jgi:hypothetical protein
MDIRCWRARLWAMIVIAACSLTGRSEDTPAHIPVAHGTTLDGTAVVLPDVLDTNGTVRWQAEGEPTDAALAEFKVQLDSLLVTTGAN